MGAERGAGWRRVGRGLLPVLVGVVGVVVGVWAGRATIGEGPSVDPPASFLTYTVGEETVERSLPIIVVAERPRELVAVNLVGGVVTRVPDLEGAAATGTVVYEVAGVPVRVVEGAVPFYRELGPVLQGEDVAQLQAVLVALGYLEAEPDGRFGASTSAAVRAWRRDLGLGDGNRVALGELIAVPGLPRLVSVDDGIQVGRLAAVGSDALFVFSAEAVFEVPLTDAQALALHPEAALVVEHDGMVWQARVVSSRSDPGRGQVVLSLAGLDGGPVCGEACHTLPVEGRVQLRGRMVSVPQITGPAVPVAALQTDAAGAAWVRLETGVLRPVEVLAIAGGLAIVEGVEVGERVLVGGGNGGEDG